MPEWETRGVNKACRDQPLIFHIIDLRVLTTIIPPTDFITPDPGCAPWGYTQMLPPRSGTETHISAEKCTWFWPLYIAFGQIALHSILAGFWIYRFHFGRLLWIPLQPDSESMLSFWIAMDSMPYCLGTHFSERNGFGCLVSNQNWIHYINNKGWQVWHQYIIRLWHGPGLFCDNAIYTSHIVPLHNVLTIFHMYIPHLRDGRW